MKFLSLVGARPQFVKLAPLCTALRRERGIRHVIVHSGQHYDYRMSKVFFDRLGIPSPNYNLNVGSGLQGEQTGECLKRFERILIKERPDWVLIFGDTNTTLAGALAAQKLHIRVAHIEAGLRSYNRRMPEEINRIVADHCSDILLCPTPTAISQVKNEGFTTRRNRFPYAVNVGDIMFDVLRVSLPEAEKRKGLLLRLDLKPRQYFLATIHRQENTDNPQRLRTIFQALERISRSFPVVLPIHPRTQLALKRIHWLPKTKSLKLIPPVDYFEMLLLQRHAKKVLTDSGGVQKEAYLLNVPCVTLREETEWVETLRGGWNQLVGVQTDRIVLAALSTPRTQQHPAYYGNGHAAEKIIRALKAS